MKKQSGFTLVELAIALMVIGLLIGGVLKGQELIENARITRFVKDINDYETAITIFRSIYNELPGDMKQVSRLPDCTAPPCSNQGTGDGTITTTHSSPERINVWVHLHHANLIASANPSGATLHEVSPINSFGGRCTLRSRAGALGNEAISQHYYSCSNVSDDTSFMPLRVTLKIDNKMDDGKPASGRMALDTTHSTACYDSDTLEYIVTSSSATRCMMLITSYATE